MPNHWNTQLVEEFRIYEGRAGGNFDAAKTDRVIPLVALTRVAN